MLQCPGKPPSTGFRCVEAAEIGTKAVFFLEIKMGPELIKAILRFSLACDEWQKDSSNSYSIIEQPKLEIADELLRCLGLPTGPGSKQ